MRWEAYVMDEVASTRRSPKPFFTVAAWLSLLVPLLAAGWVYYVVALAPPPITRLSKAELVVLALVFAGSFVAGCVSLWGVKANGALVILPPALLGILASVMLEAFTLFVLLLSSVPFDSRGEEASSPREPPRPTVNELCCWSSSVGWRA
jgi:hypothetical protein